MKKVLIVEDDATMRNLLTTLLKLEGYVPVLIEDDSEVGILQAVDENSPDLILMDVNLRLVNGLDMLHRIRSVNDYNDIRILMSSGMDYRIESKQAGADNFILKPYMPDDLVHEIQVTLGTNSSG